MKLALAKLFSSCCCELTVWAEWACLLWFQIMLSCVTWLDIQILKATRAPKTMLHSYSIHPKLLNQYGDMRYWYRYMLSAPFASCSKNQAIIWLPCVGLCWCMPLVWDSSSSFVLVLQIQRMDSCTCRFRVWMCCSINPLTCDDMCLAMRCRWMGASSIGPGMPEIFYFPWVVEDDLSGHGDHWALRLRGQNWNLWRWVMLGMP